MQIDLARARIPIYASIHSTIKKSLLYAGDW